MPIISNYNLLSIHYLRLYPRSLDTYNPLTLQGKRLKNGLSIQISKHFSERLYLGTLQKDLCKKDLAGYTSYASALPSKRSETLSLMRTNHKHNRTKQDHIGHFG